MTAEDWFASDPDEPLGLWHAPTVAPEAQRDLRARAFEYSSRGARVPGRLLLPPEGDGPFPLLVLLHGARGSKDADYVGPVAAPWARGGAAVATIDLPLHGARANPKLAEVLHRALSPAGEPTETERAVLEEFVRQAVLDLGRAVDAATQLPALDPERLVFAGLSLGAIVGVTWCAADPRPAAAAFALGGGGFGGPRVDPAGHVAAIAPRPILFANMTRDATVPRAAAQALHRASRDPAEVLWFEGDHRDLPGRALKAMWLFLRPHLGLGPRNDRAGAPPRS